MHSTRLFFSGAILLYLYSVHCTPLGHPVHNDVGSCRKTKVAVLGAGMAGITAAVSADIYFHSRSPLTVSAENPER